MYVDLFPIQLLCTRTLEKKKHNMKDRLDTRNKKNSNETKYNKMNYEESATHI